MKDERQLELNFDDPVEYLAPPPIPQSGNTFWTSFVPRGSGPGSKSELLAKPKSELLSNTCPRTRKRERGTSDSVRT